MSEQKEIWSHKTGILDLPENWRDLEVPEMVSVRDAWKSERKRLESSGQLGRFTEQLNREWAIETGIIENLYEIERGVTRTLIEQGFQAALLEMGTTNKPREWVIQLLKDQQDALEGLFYFVNQSRPLSTSYIKELHSALLRHQNYVDGVDVFGNSVKTPLIRGDWKSLPNYPTRDGIIFQYCPPEQVASEIDRLLAMHQRHVEQEIPAEIESAWLHHRFSQIHPFQDGNGRVARTLASLVFIQKDLFPLVVTRDEKVDYLNALEAADSGNLAALVTLFASLQRRRFRIAVSTSEITQRTGVDQALAGIRESISQKVEPQKAEFDRVFDLAKNLEDRAFARLSEIATELQDALWKLERTSRVAVDRSNAETDHFFRGQIIEIALDHLDYYANPVPYRSWVRLKMIWTRRANLVLTFHAIGYEFSGVMVCAPFLEFQDDDQDDARPQNDAGSQKTLVNVATEPFEFFHSENLNNIEKRFEGWLEKVLTVSLAELQANL